MAGSCSFCENVINTQSDFSRSLLNPLLRVFKFSWKKPSHPHRGRILESQMESRHLINLEYSRLPCPLSLSPVWCKYEENSLTGDIYTRILIGHITNISKLSGFLPLLIFILLYKSLYHPTNYSEGPLHAALRNFMWSNKLADCSWLHSIRSNHGMGQSGFQNTQQYPS